ncbi:MAG TPA: DNA polymerase Y family protein [Sphingomicrobium sp.]|nr:DNA polymerase Y family protein [Sphingomicrobium sp.]
MGPRRIASIWLPHLAIERWTKASDCAPEAPVVLTVEGTHGPVIHAVTRAAAARGARAGARLTDARALDPALISVPADPGGDAALVQRLASWAGRWSPLVEADGDGLRLDVTGVAHLFGGEEALAADIEQRFAALGLTARIAIAPTAAAAWALARYQPLSSSREKDLVAQLSPLPVAALRLDPDTVRTLERLGLKTIGALTAVPRLALARRFRGAADVVDALDRMLGRKPEPLTAAPAEPAPRASLRLEEPATHPEAAAQALERLIPSLVCELEERHLGARRLSLAGYRVDGSVALASVATAIPSRDPKHLQRLLAEKAAALDPSFGFDAFALAAEWSEDLDAAQESLVEEPSGDAEIARLVDRLTVKLGARRVRRPQRHESHLPERASGWIAAVSPSPLCGGEREPRSGGRERGREAKHPLSPTPLPQRGEGLCRRPQRLLDRPEAIDVIYATPEGMPRRFVWRRGVHDIARAEGPERIAPEWWRQPGSARLRDYYRVEDEAGRRYWIYREGLIGDGRGGAPAWFIHGLFG